MNVTGGLTDSQVAAHVVTRGMSSAYPLCCVCMELSAQLEERNAILELDWIPRDQNPEADALADGRSEGFSPNLRVDARHALSHWLVLDKLLDEGATFYAENAPLKDALFKRASSPRVRQGGPAKKLRETEPW